ncbi:MAG: DNA mismatch repair protein MutS, partial [Bacteroidota bacterium]
MGDFYETFDDDAKTTAKVLGITLTKRGSGSAGEVPLAGFPYHALESYLPKLLKAGYRVAVCEQLEDPKFAKGIVKRDVIEVVTPGVAFSEKVLEQKQNNYLAAIALPSALATANEKVGFAFIDVSTGEYTVSEFPLRNLAEQVGNLRPSEILVQKRDVEPLQHLLKERFSGLYSKLDDWVFNYDYGYELLVNHFKTQSLKGFGVEEMRVGVVAAGAVMNYLQETQKANLLHIKKISPHDVSDYIALDESTKRNLEISSSLAPTGSAGLPGGTLFSVIDRTQTPMGGRMLKKWVNQPLKKLAPIQERLDAVSELVGQKPTRDKIRNELARVGDLERLIAKIATGRANPRELNYLRDALALIPDLQSFLGQCKSTSLVALRKQLNPLEEVVSKIRRAIADDPPMALVDGGVIRAGYSAELDGLRDLAFHGKDWVAKLQQQERQRTGISSLKVGYNNV